MRYILIFLFAVLLCGCVMAPRVAYVSPPVSSEILVRNNSGADLKLYYGGSEVGAISAGDAGVVTVPVGRPHCYYDSGYRDWGILQMETYGGAYYYCQPQKNYTLIGKIFFDGKVKTAVKTFNFSTSADYPLVEFNKWDFSQ